MYHVWHHQPAKAMSTTILRGLGLPLAALDEHERAPTTLPRRLILQIDQAGKKRQADTDILSAPPTKRCKLRLDFPQASQIEEGGRIYKGELRLDFPQALQILQSDGAGSKHKIAVDISPTKCCKLRPVSRMISQVLQIKRAGSIQKAAVDIPLCQIPLDIPLDSRVLQIDGADGKRKAAVDMPGTPPTKRCKLRPVFRMEEAGRKHLAAVDIPGAPSTKCSKLPRVSRNFKRKRDADSTNIVAVKRQFLYEESRSSVTDLLRYHGAATGALITVQETTVDVPLLLILPNELLLQVISLLCVDDLRTCTGLSSLFKELAAPLYFAAFNFNPKDPFWISVNHKNCKALLVWRRMACFTSLKSLYISLGSSQDHHLRALDLFFRSPQCANIPTVYLSCYEAQATSASFVTLVEGIRESGCREISYSGCSQVLHSQGTIPKSIPKSTRTIHSRLESFSADCNTVFSPPLLSFTLTTLQHSPLRDLSLNDTGLSSSRWTKLLSTLNLPNLRHLEVDPQCPLRALLNFLQCHHRIDFLQVAPHGGPPAYVAKLVAHLETPDTEGDILKHCAPWLTAFPELKNVTLVPAGSRNREEIEQIRNCFLSNAVDPTNLDVKDGQIVWISVQGMSCLCLRRRAKTLRRAAHTDHESKSTLSQIYYLIRVKSKLREFKIVASVSTLHWHTLVGWVEGRWYESGAGESFQARARARRCEAFQSKLRRFGLACDIQDSIGALLGAAWVGSVVVVRHIEVTGIYGEQLLGRSRPKLHSGEG
ncbi:hypothetical protein BU15DRAFT_69097 [Melanogaster broomeanus]|nr:hypothetical protein BU15DRAFT_69097 [Melanogaster broomeanus]